ncbi:MAG: hypothetical protein QM733_19485 [Ilumatobacteraceae bacterium]
MAKRIAARLVLAGRPGILGGEKDADGVVGEGDAGRVPRRERVGQEPLRLAVLSHAALVGEQRERAPPGDRPGRAAFGLVDERATQVDDGLGGPSEPHQGAGTDAVSVEPGLLAACSPGEHLVRQCDTACVAAELPRADGRDQQHLGASRMAFGVEDLAGPGPWLGPDMDVRVAAERSDDALGPIGVTG